MSARKRSGLGRVSCATPASVWRAMAIMVKLESKKRFRVIGFAFVSFTTFSAHHRGDQNCDVLLLS